jgi:hypothetical protein
MAAIARDQTPFGIDASAGKAFDGKRRADGQEAV